VTFTKIWILEEKLSMGRRTIMLVFFFFIVFQSSGQDSLAGDDQELIIFSIEYYAEFPGGVESLKSFVYKNLKRHPNDPKGKVFVQFTVNTDGTTSDYKVVRSLNEGCDKRAIEVLQGMPRWTPARQNNTPVRIKFVMPIQF
jgi:protein TonB